MGDGPVIALQDVTKVYRQGSVDIHALRGLSMEVEPGEFTAVCGPSGSGKTTMLNLIGALDAATSGSIVLEGQELGSLNKKELSELRRDRIGFVFQAYNLMPVPSPAIRRSCSPTSRPRTWTRRRRRRCLA